MCRDGLYEWDQPEYRRNYGEPLHEEWWKYQETRFTPMSSRSSFPIYFMIIYLADYRYTRREMFITQLCVGIFLITCIVITETGRYGIPK